MREISQIKSFEAFKISKQQMNKVSGSRTVEYEQLEGENGGCAKIIDNNEGGIRKIKVKDRYEDRC